MTEVSTGRHVYEDKGEPIGRTPGWLSESVRAVDSGQLLGLFLFDTSVLSTSLSDDASFSWSDLFLTSLNLDIF